MTILGESTKAPSARRHALSRRRKLLAGVGAVVLAAGVLGGCISADQVTVQNLLNADRTNNGRSTLADMAQADTKAQAWAQKLANDGVLSHSNLADGYSGVTWCKLGENVGMGASLEIVEAAFMNSPGHRANILDTAYNRVGSGVVKTGNTYFVVQEFVQTC